MCPNKSDCEMWAGCSGTQFIVVRLPRTASMISSLTRLIIVWIIAADAMQSQ